MQYTMPADNRRYDILRHEIFYNDQNRGKFNHRVDYVLACISHMFGMVNLFLLPIACLAHGGLFFWFLYLMMLSLITGPIIFLETFIGQFTSTGFISSYRMAPLMKGLPYVMLIFNLLQVSRNSLLAAVPIHMIFPENRYLLDFNSPNYSLFGCNFFVWVCATVIVVLGVQKFGKCLYVTLGVPVALMLVCFARFGIHPGFQQMYYVLLNFPINTFISPSTWISAGLFAIMTLGQGIGIFTTLGSFNNFRENPERIVFIAPLVVAGISFMNTFTIFGMLALSAAEYNKLSFSQVDRNIQNIYGPIQRVDSPYLWRIFISLIWFFMELNHVVIILLSCVTSLYDEFPKLRRHKTTFTCFLSTTLFIFSLLYCIPSLNVLVWFSLAGFNVVLIFLYLVEVLTIVWAYGQKRFVRDIEMMLKRKFLEWKFILYKFVTPLTLLIFLILSIIFMDSAANLSTKLLDVHIELIFYSIPLIIIPVYAIAKGYSRGRFCSRGNYEHEEKWHPAQSDENTNFEEYNSQAGYQQELLHQRNNNDDQYI